MKTPATKTQAAGHGEADRIIHVPRRYTSREWGGTETVIQNLSRVQRAQGWRTEIATSQALDARPSDCLDGTPVRRFRHRYPFLGLSAEARAAMDKKGGNLISLPLFWHLLRSRRVRLYHAHAIKRLGGMVRTAARWNRKPYVVTLHGGFFDMPEAEHEDLVEAGRGCFEWGKGVGALLGSRKVLNDADHVICVGKAERDKALDRLSHDRVSWLPNGVDFKKFTTGDGRRFRAAHDIPADAFVVLCVSRIDSQKNQVSLVEAFARFLKQQPHSRLVLAGPCTQPAYQAKLTALIDRLKLRDRVLLLPGFANHDPSLADAFHAGDVFVLPSRHEPFGIVVLEAWSAGKPVIASQVGGLKSLIVHGRNGLHYESESDAAVEDLSAQLRRLAGSPNLRRQLAEAGRREARDEYSWTEIGRRQEEIYQAAEKRRARSRDGSPKRFFELNRSAVSRTLKPGGSGA